MSRLAVAVAFLLSICAFAQTAQPISSDPLAISLAQKSLAVVTGGTPISDVTLNANVISIFGSDNETGTGTFSAKGTSESRVDLNLGGGTRSDVRNMANGTPGGAWEKDGGTSTAYAQHNCWADAAWFLPALSSLTQTANPNFVFKYIGQEQHRGVNTQHVRVFQAAPQGLQTLSTMEFYLDPISSLPLNISFNLHADNDMNRNIPVEINFANYQTVNGIQVPSHFQRMFNGQVVLDVTVTSAVFNTGLPDTLFALQ